MHRSKKDGYFHRVHRLSPTRFWINNPTPKEAAFSIEAGAVACTTNPTYVANQLRRNDVPEAVYQIVDELNQEADSNDQAVDRVMQELIKPIMEQFRSLYERSSGEAGFVSIQGNPHHDDDAERIVNEAIEYRKLGRNFIAKVAVTPAGLKAIEALIELDIPIIATEIMGLPQAIATCELYNRVSERSGKRPALYVTHITGIFDEYLQRAAERHSYDIEPDILFQAGSIVARRQYVLMQERGYPGVFLGGGARGLHHFTELVGGDLHITINWQRAAAELIKSNPPVIWRMFNPAPEAVVEELLAKVPAFRSAYCEDGLSAEEFAEFGPVQHFREMFVQGWDSAARKIASRRQ